MAASYDLYVADEFFSETNFSFEFDDFNDSVLELNYTSVDFDLEPDGSPNVVKRTFIGQTLIIIINAILNLTVIALVIYLYVRRRDVVQKSPQLIPMLGCCVVHLGGVVWHSHLTHNTLHNFRSEEMIPTTCLDVLVLELCGSILYPVASLLVASVVAAEFFRLQYFCAFTWMVQKIMAVMLMFLSVAYGVIFLIPLFLITMLDDLAKPCDEYEGRSIVNLRYNSLPVYIFSIFYYIVPSVFLLLACGLLIAAYVFNRRSSTSVKQSSGYVISHNNAIPLLTTPEPATPENVSQPVLLTWPFPFNVVFAAAVCIVFNFIDFYRLIEDLGNIQLWIAATMLGMLTTVLVPVCWLLDTGIRAVWCCCCGARSGSGSNSASSSPSNMPGVMPAES